MHQDFNILYKKIGYTFKNQKLIKIALTHRSKDKNNNERLEFLGDSILNFVISEILYKKFIHENEGILSMLRISLVNGKTLTSIAKKFDLGQHINFGIGAIKSGEYNRSRLLEDCLESIIGAIFLDSNIETVKNCISMWYNKIISEIHINDKSFKDPKSKLQEHLQSKTHTIPKYKIISISGPEHDRVFVVEVYVSTLDESFQGTGKSKKQAEHNAAEKAHHAININKD